MADEEETGDPLREGVRKQETDSAREKGSRRGEAGRWQGQNLAAQLTPDVALEKYILSSPFPIFRFSKIKSLRTCLSH